MDPQTRDRLVGRYKAGYRVVADALAGATDAELDAKPAPNKWSAREIVHHLADSEITSGVRLRLLLAADHPQITAYDQEEFARTLHYERPTDASIELFKAVRRSTGELLDLMSDADWTREGTHSELGPYSAEKWLEIYAAHAHGHAEQIIVARGSAKEKKAS